ncbi:MAG: S8 family serine peptidase [bacterium]
MTVRTRRRVGRVVAGGLVGGLMVCGTGLVATVPGRGPIPASAAPGPAAYPEYWFDDWGVSRLWSRGVRGNGITVAVVDTGVEATVAELSGKVLAGTDLTGLGGDGRTDRAIAPFSHGTAMASLIVASGGHGLVNGVAPAARILPIAVPLGDTRSTREQIDETPNAIRFAADHGADVISMSFGAPRRPSIHPSPCPAETQAAIFHALRRGAIVIASAGNSGTSGSPVEEPSVCLGVISVGAVNRDGQRPRFSSVHRYLTLAAPGDAVTSLSRTGDVYVGSGTSQAAALTAGAVALIWSAHRGDSNRQVTARLMAGLHDAGPKGRDREFGYGIVDAAAGVDATPTEATPNPVFTGADPFLRALDPLAATRLPTPPPVTVADPPGRYVAAGRPPAIESPIGLGAAMALAGALGLLGLWLTRRRPVAVPRSGRPTMASAHQVVEESGAL